MDLNPISSDLDKQHPISPKLMICISNITQLPRQRSYLATQSGNNPSSSPHPGRPCLLHFNDTGCVAVCGFLADSNVALS